MGQGEDEFRLFRPTPPHSFPSPPRLALLRVIIVNFSYLKILLFKTNILILVYFILPNTVLYLYFVMCYNMSFFFFFFLMIFLLNTWIYFQFFLKIDLILWDKFNCNFKYIFINEIGFIKKIVLVVGKINKK